MWNKHFWEVALYSQSHAVTHYTARSALLLVCSVYCTCLRSLSIQLRKSLHRRTILFVVLVSRWWNPISKLTSLRFYHTGLLFSTRPSTMAKSAPASSPKWRYKTDAESMQSAWNTSPLQAAHQLGAVHAVIHLRRTGLWITAMGNSWWV